MKTPSDAAPPTRPSTPTPTPICLVPLLLLRPYYHNPRNPTPPFRAPSRLDLYSTLPPYPRPDAYSAAPLTYRETVQEEGGNDAADAAPLLGPVPLVAIPVIAGMGSEVTPMSTILDDEDPLEPEKVRRDLEACVK